MNKAYKSAVAAAWLGSTRRGTGNDPPVLQSWGLGAGLAPRGQALRRASRRSTRGRASSSRRRRRPAYTLIEIAPVLAIISLVMTAMTAVTHALHRTGSQLRHSWEEERAISSLAIQLRRDAHLALSASSVEAAGESELPADLLLRLANDTTIRYRFSPRGIQRRVQSGSGRQHLETFRVSVAAGTNWRVRDNRGPPLLQLQLERQMTPGSPGSLVRTEQIVAAIGLIGS